MNGKDLFFGLNHIDPAYIEEAEMGAIRGRPGGGYAHAPGLRRTLLVAAAVGLALLLVGCAVAYTLRLGDLKVGQDTVPRYSYDPESSRATLAEQTMDVISLQGIQGSPNFQAAKEWHEFESSYDPEHTRIDNSFVHPREYDGYALYNQEMADKVAQLCEKYHLKPLGETVRMQTYQFDVLYKALGIDALFQEGAQAENGVGYFTQYGNFNLMFSLTLPGEKRQRKEPVYATWRYVDKACFDTMNAVVDCADGAGNWNYTLADGTEVLLVRNEGSALILCDRADAFQSVFLEAYDPAGHPESLAKGDIELAAQCLNFTVKPRQPDMAQAQKLLLEAEQAHQQALAAMSAGPEGYVDTEVCGSYQELLEKSENIASLTRYGDGGLYYALVDLNGDGTKELLTGGEADSFGCIHTVAEGKTKPLLYNGHSLYLCEDGVVELWSENGGGFSHWYSRYDPENREDVFPTVDFVGYNGNSGRWYGSGGPETEISEEQAQAILNAHPRVALELKPIEEFSME